MRLEDWEEVTTWVFCRDNPDENVDAVYLIVSNGQWRERSQMMQTADGAVKTELNCDACVRTTATTRRKARFTVSYDESDSGDGPGYPVSARARRNGTYPVCLALASSCGIRLNQPSVLRDVNGVSADLDGRHSRWSHA